MLVREGDSVEKDQPLLRIDDTRATALLRELQAKTHALAAAAARARAEAYGGKPEFPAEARASPELIRRETEAFNARRRALDASVEAPRRDLALQLSDRQNKFRTDAAADLIKFEAELSQARETLVARADAAERTEIRSPMKGTVKSIRVSTIGGVVQAGQEIMTIVPTEDTLVIEAYVRHADVAFIHPGQKAVVKISAYDYAIYGGLDGTVENISPDTLRDQPRARSDAR